MNILDLPDCVLELVMSYLTYDDIAKYRNVSERSFICIVTRNLCFPDLQKVQSNQHEPLEPRLLEVIDLSYKAVEGNKGTTSKKGV